MVNFTKHIIIVFLCLCITGLSSETALAQPLNYRLKWLFNASVVGDLYADVHGFFKAEGLEVNVRPGGPERDAIKELELGQAQFGVASADQVIRSMDKGAPVVVLAQIFQANPLQWMYRADAPPIERLIDLKGRILGVTFGGNDETILRTLMARGGLTESDVTLFSVRFDYTPFFQKKVDIWPVYINTQAVFLKKKLKEGGENVRFFNPSEYGVRFVANSVVTSRKMIETSPDIVQKFTAALMKAWETALHPDNHDKAVEALKTEDKDTDTDVIEDQLNATRMLVKPSADVAVGTIDLPAWEQTEAIMLAQRLIKKPVGVKSAIYQTE